MSAAHTLRVQIEASLAERVPYALTLQPKTSRLAIACGIGPADEALYGGLPCAGISELVGPESSGRTSLALAYVAAVIEAGSVCAWIDVADALCPESVAANGIDLERLLWVRCGLAQPLPARAVHGQHESPASSAVGATPQPRSTGGCSQHPRSEGHDMPESIHALLKSHGASGSVSDGQLRREKKFIGTPGAANRPVARRPEQREEQVNSDRMPPRRGDNLAIAPRCAEPQPRRVANLTTSKMLPRERLSGSGWSRPGMSYQAIDQAMRSTDLLLQSGGFSVIVFDLGSTPREIAWRIPMATWFRFRAACDRTQTSLLLLTQHPCARSSAELVVRMQAGEIKAQSKVMTGIGYRAASERSRSNERAARIVPIRKPPQSERPGHWTSQAAWGQSK